MRVSLIAHTHISDGAVEDLGYELHRDHGWTTETGADELAEFAGRNCYQSFDRPNPATATNKDYLANILRQRHESVLEHASATFYIEASRSVLAELTRHRHLSFSVVSQRYVDASRLGIEIPPAVYDLPEEDREHVLGIMTRHSHRSIVDYRQLVQIYERNGLPRKKAREAARAVIPNMTSSPMVVTGNHRAWRDVLRKRWHVAADAEIRDLAGRLLEELRKIAPNTYQDIPQIPFDN